MDSRSFSTDVLEALNAGEFVFEANEMKKEPVIKIWASIEADKKAVRELLRQSLDCCSIMESGKIEVLEKTRLKLLHEEAAKIRVRASHNEAVLDRFDAAHVEALAMNPILDPTLFALRSWQKTLKERVARSKGIIRTTTAIWLASPEGVNYTIENLKNHLRVAPVIATNMPIIEVGEKELLIATAHLEKAQAILGEAILPGKEDSILPKNEFDQAINRATAL
jgi:hypothetical protein